MEHVICNLRGKPYRTKFQGRDYLVAHLTLIQPGVLNGSQGPLLYPDDEIQATADAWNGMPMLLNHPADGSGRDPAIYNQSGLGTVYRAQFDASLQAQGWFDIERCNNIYPGLILRIESGEAVELSTGLRVTAEVGNGEFNGVQYIAVARNYRPDHLAILPTATGACSIKDGCGVNNELSHDEVRSQIYRALEARKGSDSDLGCYIVEVFDDYFIYEEGPNFYRLGYSIKDEQVQLAVAGPVRVEKEVKYVLTTNSAMENTMPKLTDEQRKTIVDGLVANCTCWKEDKAVLEALNDDALGKVNDIYTKMKELTDSNKELTTANATQKKILEIAQAGIEVGDKIYTFNENGEWSTTNKTVKEEPKGVTLKDLPEDIQEDLAFARNMKAAQRKQYEDAILANEKAGYTADDLKDMPLSALQKLATALTANKAAGGDPPQRHGAFVLPAEGGETSVSNTLAAKDQKDVIGEPVWNFENPLAAK